MEEVKLDPKVLKGLKKYRSYIEDLYSSGIEVVEIARMLKGNYGLSVESFIIGCYMTDWGIELDRYTMNFVLRSKAKRQEQLEALAPLKEKIVMLYVDEKKSPDSITRILKLEDGFTYSNAVVKSFLTYYCPEVEMRNWEKSMNNLRVFQKNNKK